jgi:hypothetical protein
MYRSIVVEISTISLHATPFAGLGRGGSTLNSGSGGGHLPLSDLWTTFRTSVRIINRYLGEVREDVSRSY